MTLGDDLDGIGQPHGKKTGIQNRQGSAFDTSQRRAFRQRRPDETGHGTGQKLPASDEKRCIEALGHTAHEQHMQSPEETAGDDPQIARL